ncbi:MarR family transcriptional regulator [Streptomyces exfoliatus]|uniref:MarR family transcriptional regulator n=1 Tax=Streptomyces exfoliatus TaxID=1905 RepID=A0ABV3CY80_STREX
MPTRHQDWQQTLHHRMWKASQALHRTLNEKLADLGLTINQLALAVTLAQHAPLSSADLARSQGITPQTANSALAHLDRLGWLERRPHPVHKRVVLLDLTKEGHAGVAAGRARTDAVMDRMRAALGGARQAEEFLASLRRVSDEFDGPDTPPGQLWPGR